MSVDKSVENFFQDSIFEDIFPTMPTKTPLSVVPERTRLAVVQIPVALKQQGEKQQSESVTPLSESFRVVRSARRKRGVSAFRSHGVIEIHIPDRTSRRAERELIPEMIALVLAREAKSRRGDAELGAIALRLLAEHLPEFHERPTSITWRAMTGRWGSCTTVDGTIRIASRLMGVPGYVLECIIFHELLHLRIPGHGSDFDALMARYPHLERAEAFLEGFESGLAAAPEEITAQELS